MRYIKKKSVVNLPSVVDNIVYNYINKIKDIIMKTVGEIVIKMKGEDK